jgi:hypothetical protein
VELIKDSNSKIELKLNQEKQNISNSVNASINQLQNLFTEKFNLGQKAQEQST